MVTREQKRALEQRRKFGWECASCGRGTAALDDVGEPQCLSCRRELRAATATARAVCGCGNPMLSEAERCGLCEIELQHA